MMNVLVPVSSAQQARVVTSYLTDLASHVGGLKIHLLHVSPRLTRHAARWIPSEARAAMARDRARKHLQPVAAALAGKNVEVTMHTARGDIAQAVADTARRLGCGKIVVGSKQRSSLSRLLDNSVANRIMAHTAIPVAVVPGGRASLAERVVVPSGVGAALVLLALD